MMSLDAAQGTLLRYIADSARFVSTGAAIEQFQHDYEIPTDLVDPLRPDEGTQTDVLLRALVREGVLTLRDEIGFGWPEATVTERGRRYLRAHLS